MMRIFLKGIQFHAFHGVYKEEERMGNTFGVDMEVFFDETGYINRLDQTISYSDLYMIVNERMKAPAKLLETIAMDIVTTAKEQFQQITEINITISKMNPPIPNFQGETGVSYHKKFD